MIGISSALSANLQDQWRDACCTCLVFIWKARNKKLFDGIDTEYFRGIHDISKAMRRAHFLSKAFSVPSDSEALQQLHLFPKLRPAPKCLECYWLPPPVGMVKINTDGASKGNPGKSGYGAIVRNYSEHVLGVLVGDLGEETSYIAETIAITAALQIAKKHELEEGLDSN